MRTTIDLPDDLLRRVKAQAALDGRTLKDVIQEYVEDGLERRARTAPPPAPTESKGLRIRFPTIPTAALGTPHPSLTPEQIKQLEEEEDIERYDRLVGRKRMDSSGDHRP